MKFKIMLKYCLLSLFLITGYCLTAQQPAFITDSLDIYIQREMQRWQVPGLAIAIVKDGKVVATKGYGVTDLETKKPVDANTLFMIASNTKAFTGTSLAILEKQGRISLNDKVIKYLPYFALNNPEITKMVTIEDVLSHRLGFETFQGDFLNWESNLSRKELIQNMQKNIPPYDFRDTYGYCNAGFLTAGEIILAVTDTSWDDYLKYHFFNPLKMTRTSTTYAALLKDENKCSPYTIFNGKLVKLDYDNLDNLGPAASINSSVNDLSHWLLLQLANGKFEGKEIISAEAIKNTRLPRSVAGSGSSGLYKSQHFNLYGLGWFLKDYEGKKLMTHSGGANGFVTTTLVVPEAQLGVIVLTNTDANGLYEALQNQIFEAYLGLPYRNLSSIYYGFYAPGYQETDIQLAEWAKLIEKNHKPALDLNAYTGKYYNSVYGEITIENKNGALEIHFAHHPQLTGNLKSVGENKFICYYNPVSWGVKETPFTVENNKVKSVTITINDFIDFLPYEFVKQE